jgi:hypothetical protein
VRAIAWALAICFVAITALSCRYAFTIPIVFSTLITVCLTAAAWLSAKTGFRSASPIYASNQPQPIERDTQAQNHSAVTKKPQETTRQPDRVPRPPQTRENAISR